MSTLTAGHLRQVPGEHLQLAGQGIRDVTRIAASDPVLWRQIISANAARQAPRRIDAMTKPLSQPIWPPTTRAAMPI